MSEITQSDAPETSGQETQGEENIPQWYFSAPNEETQSEGVAGNGDVPDWFVVDKYKSVEEQAKGYKELSSRFGGFESAPEEYQLPEGFEEDAVDNGMLDILKSVGKENQMGQGMFNQLVSQVSEYQNKQIEAQQQQAMEKLGPEAEQRISKVNNWLNTNAPKEMVDIIAPMGTSAEAIQAIEWFIDKSKGTTVADANAQPATKMSQADYAAKLMATDAHGNLRISVDPEYKKEIDALTASRL